MKTIFIVTDFSDASHNASRYGIELADFFGAGVVLFNAYSVPVSIPETYVVIDPGDIRKSAEEQLQAEVLKLRKSTSHTIEILAEEGVAADIIISTAKKYDDCLIVCGMKGEGKSIKKVFGSTVTALSRKSSIPMLVVPSDAIYAPIHNIALASDIDIETDIHTVDMLQDIGEKSGAKLYVVRVIKDTMDEVQELMNRSERMRHHLKSLDPEFVFPHSNNIGEALQDFVKEYNVQLLAMIPHHHNIMERLLFHSETKQLIFHTHVPLLVLPEVKFSL